MMLSAISRRSNNVHLNLIKRNIFTTTPTIHYNKNKLNRINDSNIASSTSSLFYKHFSYISSSIQQCNDSNGTDNHNNFIDEDIEEIDTLLRIRSADLQYPENNHNNCLSSINLSIKTPFKTKNSTGAGTGTGHVLLGKNGYGKTLLSSTLSHYDSNNSNNNPYLKHGSIEYNQRWYKHYVSKVSFQSHLDLLSLSSSSNNTEDDINKNNTVYRALTPYGGKLNKSAQYLVVRFGLYPLLHSPIQSISTGEIRKVLLIKALSLHTPKLLLLDNAFDGLDLKSRNNLKELVNKTINGFRPDMLVQDVVNNVKSMDHTQVMVITHRAEEIVEGISNISMIQNNGNGNGLLVTEKRNGRSGSQLLYSALNDNHHHDHCSNEIVNVEDADKWNTIDNKNTWNDSSLPSTHDINHILNRGKQQKQHDDSASASSVVIEANNLKVQRGNSTPISNLTWKVHKGQRWLIAGGNGAGKSTISRLLAHFNNNNNDDDHGITNGTLTINKDMKIGWVSTELHMSLTQSSRIAKDILLNPYNKVKQEDDEPISNDIINAICKWFNISTHVLHTPFNQLSQGEQKLIVIASTLIIIITQKQQKNTLQKLIILDEPCQGLDIYSRKRILGLFERICCSCDDITFIYITHHMEEIIPSVNHVLHLVDGGIGYIGAREHYNPDSIKA